jgi:tetratricopeptide (TPR) repeat protein
MDHELLAGLPSLLPLCPLSAALGVVQKDVDTSLLVLAGRYEEARQMYLQILTRIEQPDRAGLEGMYYANLRLSIMMAIGQVELSRGMPSTEHWAPELENSPLFAVTAWRMRQQAALILGDLRQAEQHRAAAERLQIQNCPPQLFEGLHLWPEVVAHADAEDLLRVKQGAVEIEALARQHPGWQPCLHFARGAYQALRGDNERALEELERALRLSRLGRHMSWVACANRVLQLLNRQGRFEEALARGNAMLLTLQEHGMANHGYALMSALALAEAALGDLALAVPHAEAAISDMEMRGAQGVALGAAYEARARVAVYAKDTADFERYAQLCDEQYRIGQNAALVARTKRLLRDAVDAGVVTAPLVDVTVTPDPEEWASSLATLLSTCQRPDERAERALTLIAEQSQSAGGYLYTLQAEGPVLVATHGATPPPAHLDGLVTSYLASATDDSTDMEATTLKSAARRREPETARSRGWASAGQRSGRVWSGGDAGGTAWTAAARAASTAQRSQ